MTEFRLREMRERAGLSVEELAALTNTPRLMIAALDSGNAEVMWTTAVNIAIALGCSLDELAGIDQGETK